MLKTELKKLNKESFSNIKAKEIKIKNLLTAYQEELQKDPFNNELQLKEKNTREAYIQAQKDLYSFLQQKAKVNWVKGGDDNTAFFHAIIKDRRTQNRILSIESKEGTRCEDPEQAEMLLRDITKEEVREVLFGVPRSKAPSPDGYSSYFFRTTGKLKEMISLEQCPHFFSLDLIRHFGRKSTKPGCVIKLDIQKAYDTLDWDYLEEILQAFKFPHKFIKLIMTCGLKKSSNSLKGVKISILTTYAFADDVILFCHGDFKSIYCMLHALKLLSSSSGLHPNPSKSAIYCCGMEDREGKIGGVIKLHFKQASIGIEDCGSQGNSQAIHGFSAADERK
uniref:Reverse transcriptase domain-containing protein n=1 Tax=Cannabis sativa TaxID=3483 RepID=A0A803QJR3_CANSA